MAYYSGHMCNTYERLTQCYIIVIDIIVFIIYWNVYKCGYSSWHLFHEIYGDEYGISQLMLWKY